MIGTRINKSLYLYTSFIFIFSFLNFLFGKSICYCSQTRNLEGKRTEYYSHKPRVKITSPLAYFDNKLHWDAENLRKKSIKLKETCKTDKSYNQKWQPCRNFNTENMNSKYFTKRIINKDIFPTGFIEILLSLACNPVKTIFEIVWNYFVKQSTSVSSFVKWQEAMAPTNSYNIKSLLYSQFLGLKSQFLHTVLRIQKPNRQLLNSEPLFRGGCVPLEIYASVKRLNTVSEQSNYNIIDFILSSSQGLLNISKHFEGIYQNFRKKLSNLLEKILRLVCGINFWAGKMNAICAEILRRNTMSKMDEF